MARFIGSGLIAFSIAYLILLAFNFEPFANTNQPAQSVTEPSIEP